ncbi:otolin-1-like isoform X2 [Argopecten irradians]|uniref:otolin-1-like isoform X2 n=1 Tax=Argopecten irradians TaxID=31199 RepID=UPI003721987C
MLVLVALCLSAVTGQVTSETDFQSLQHQVVSLQDIVQHLVTELVGLRQEHRELEDKSQTLWEEVTSIRKHSTRKTLQDDFRNQEIVAGEPERRSYTNAIIEGQKWSKCDTGARGLIFKEETGVRGPIRPKRDSDAQGPKGDTGARGSKGDTGARGPKGDSGIPGFNGDDGFDGSKGQKGDMGIQGPKGDTGLPGLKGGVGLPGLKGDAGLPGLKGDAGLPGLKGATGAKGEPGPNAPASNAGFSARLSHQLKILGWIPHKLTFDQVDIIHGNDYRSGVFICDVSGTYVVTWALEVGARATVNSSLMKNGSEIGRLTVTGLIGTGSQVVLVTLEVDDRLHISATPNLPGATINNSSFTAFLLYK